MRTEVSLKSAPYGKGTLKTGPVPGTTYGVQPASTVLTARSEKTRENQIGKDQGEVVAVRLDGRLMERDAEFMRPSGCIGRSMQKLHPRDTAPAT